MRHAAVLQKMDRMRCGQVRSSTRIALSKFWAQVPWLLKAAIMLEVVLHKLSEAGVIGGLLISMLLSLVVTPVVFFRLTRKSREEPLEEPA